MWHKSKITGKLESVHQLLQVGEYRFRAHQSIRLSIRLSIDRSNDRSSAYLDLRKVDGCSIAIKTANHIEQITLDQSEQLRSDSKTDQTKSTVLEELSSLTRTQTQEQSLNRSVGVKLNDIGWNAIVSVAVDWAYQYFISTRQMRFASGRLIPKQGCGPKLIRESKPESELKADLSIGFFCNVIVTARAGRNRTHFYKIMRLDVELKWGNKNGKDVGCFSDVRRPSTEEGILRHTNTVPNTTKEHKKVIVCRQPGKKKTGKKHLTIRANKNCSDEASKPRRINSFKGMLRQKQPASRSMERAKDESYSGKQPQSRDVLLSLQPSLACLKKCLQVKTPQDDSGRLTSTTAAKR
ncbi:hypothetical protein CLF_113136 [Clonorchis sinensis]|uniref:Uncharacterized protein n=1 Tax=Clonorchis sinensis TaxID=79923 RepID=G7YXQ4_CLOSI|nr:hypothetical protein CLF_113136 [Clonorchis sinensis]